ncbi:helix-turn-helix transcriptional regulator [Azonexus sp.]|uniref:helix-turn-helix transcriptional regulator n=1 Tax=Azonexus sp. TaxID=1872668 RepID=UPI0035B0ACB2
MKALLPLAHFTNMTGIELYNRVSTDELPAMQPDQPKLLTKTELSIQLSISARTIENLVKAQKFPPPVRIGKNVYWSEIAVSKWRDALFSQQERWECKSIQKL